MYDSRIEEKAVVYISGVCAPVVPPVAKLLALENWLFTLIPCFHSLQREDQNEFAMCEIWRVILLFVRFLKREYGIKVE